jgi:DNA-binding CsgD family transcriptional regulator
LAAITRALRAPLLTAASAHATGAVLLTEGDFEGASSSLRHAQEIWRDLGMPYEEAQTCVLMAAVCERRGDRDGRGLELDAARRIFKQLVAAGKTNRDIGAALFISEKTVARHVSNIFDKAGVSSRAGATAWAYRRNLI